MDFVITIKILGVVLFSVFMPLTAFSFFRFRLPKKGEEYTKIVKLLELDETKATFLTPSEVKNEYSFCDYALPVGFVTFVSILGTTALLLGWELKLAEPTNLLFAGIHFGAADNSRVEYQKLSLLVLTMGFMGGYIWSIQSIFRRLATTDLPPGAYYSVGIRMVLAAFVALIMHHLLEVPPTREYTKGMIPVIAFLSGMFPEQGIHYLRERVKIFAEKSATKSADLPLDMIEGINLLHKVRLAELGIDNAQNLAESNLIELIIRTPFNPRQLIDWIGQAKLYLEFKTEGFDELRKIGIRTIFDFKTIISDEGKLSEVTNSTQISEVHLNSVYQKIKDDSSVDKLFKASNSLSVL